MSLQNIAIDGFESVTPTREQDRHDLGWHPILKSSVFLGATGTAWSLIAFGLLAVFF